MPDSVVRPTEEQVQASKKNWAVFRDNPRCPGIAYVREVGSPLYQREICVVFNEDDRVADLLAAAPHLLEALKKIVRDGDYTAPEGMKRIAQEAIAKAEGRS